MFKVAILVFVCLTTIVIVSGFKVKSTGSQDIGLFSKFPQPSEGLRRLKISGESTAYVYSTFKANAGDAQTYCQLSGTKLLSIDTTTEQLDLEKFIGSAQGECAIKSKVWTSGSDAAEEGKFRWTSTGERVMFVYWHKFENSDDKDCILIDPNYQFKWLLQNCSTENFFICEY